MDSKVGKLLFLNDIPALDDEVGTHKDVANLLANVLRSIDSSPTVLGLFGGWGTGKSSIVEMYDQIINEENSKQKNVLFDAWAFSNAKERFGPGLLIEMATQLLPSGAAHAKKQEIDKREEVVQSVPKLNTAGQLMFAVLMLVIIALALLASVGQSQFYSVIALLVSSVLLTGILNWFLPRNFSNTLTTTKQVSFNEVDHFRRIFREIVRQTKAKKISVVVDNLDRVDAEDALEMMRMIKSFVVEDRENLPEEKMILFIIPVDDKELARHLRQSRNIENSHEFLNKFITLIFYVPSIVHQNIISYTREQFEKIRIGLNPSLSKDEADVVSFILAKAARKSLRQVKLLINTFVLFWNGLGLAQQGRSLNVSHAAAAFFVGYRFLMQDKPLAESLALLFDESTHGANFSPEASDFFRRTQEYVTKISKREWLYLLWLQNAKGEQKIPDFARLYDNIIDGNSVADRIEQSGIGTFELLVELENQAREDGGPALTRVSKWTLQQIYEEKIETAALPQRLREHISYLVEDQVGEWHILIDQGLAKFTLAVERPNKLFLSALNLIAKENRVASDQERIAFSNYLSCLVVQPEISRFLEAAPHRANLLQSALSKYTENSPDLLLATLPNIDKFQDPNLGVKLAQEFVKSLEIESIKLSKPRLGQTDASAAFGRTLVEISNPPKNSARSQMWIEAVFDAMEAVQTYAGQIEALPNDSILEAKCNSIETFAANSVAQKEFKRAIAAAGVLYLLYSKCKAIKRTSISEYFLARLFQGVLPRLVGRLSDASKEDKKFFESLFRRHPGFLAIFPTNFIVDITRYPEIPVLSSLHKTGDARLGAVLSGVVQQGHWGQVLGDWCNVAGSKKMQVAEYAFAALSNSLFGQDKYKATIDALIKLKGVKEMGRIVAKHAEVLIDKVAWSSSDQRNGVLILIQQLEQLERLAPLESDVLEKLRLRLAKVDEAISTNFLALLPLETQDWINNHLVKK